MHWRTYLLCGHLTRITSNDDLWEEDGFDMAVLTASLFWGLHWRMKGKAQSRGLSGGEYVDDQTYMYFTALHWLAASAKM